MKSLAKNKGFNKAAVVATITLQPTTNLHSQKFNHLTHFKSKSTISSNNSFNHVNYSSINLFRNNLIEQVFSKHNTSTRTYSTTLIDTTTSSNQIVTTDVPSTPVAKLNVKYYESWTKEKVRSLLCAEKNEGGAGLSFSKVKPLYDAGFDGAALATIVTNIQNKDVYFAVEQLKKTFKDASFLLTVELSTTLQTVVNWTNNLLKTKLYHVWSPDYLCKQVQDEHLSKLFQQLRFDGIVLQKLVSDLKDGGIDKTIQTLQVKYKIPMEDCKSIVTWSTKFAPKAKAKIFVERYQDLSIDQKQRFINVIDSLNSDFMTDHDFDLVKEYLIPIILKLEQALDFYSNDKSKEVFNSFMEPYGLQKQDSLIHLYLSNDEKSASSAVVCCDFAPTFPKYKYAEREEFLNVRYHSQHSVSTFLEAPGSGKTHFAYHLTSNSNYMIVPIDLDTCETLIQNLKTIDTNPKYYRALLNREVETFHRFMIGLMTKFGKWCLTLFKAHLEDLVLSYKLYYKTPIPNTIYHQMV